MAVSQETLTIIGVGIALAGIIFVSNGQLGERIDRLESRIDRLDTRIDQMDTRLVRLESRIDRLEVRFDQLEARFDQLEARFDKLEARFDQLDIRLAAVEKETARIIGLLEGRDLTGLRLPSHGAPAEADGEGVVEPLLPRTSLPG